MFKRNAVLRPIVQMMLLLVAFDNGVAGFPQPQLANHRRPTTTTTRVRMASLNDDHDQRTESTNTNSSRSIDDKVPITPCTRICRYNQKFMDGRVCIGCFRDEYEISAWQGMAPMEKHYTLLDALDRWVEAEQQDGWDLAATSGTSPGQLEQQAEFWKRQQQQQQRQ